MATGLTAEEGYPPGSDHVTLRRSSDAPDVSLVRLNRLGRFSLGSSKPRVMGDGVFVSPLPWSRTAVSRGVNLPPDNWRQASAVHRKQRELRCAGDGDHRRRRRDDHHADVLLTPARRRRQRARAASRGINTQGLYHGEPLDINQSCLSRAACTQRCLGRGPRGREKER